DRAQDREPAHRRHDPRRDRAAASGAGRGRRTRRARPGDPGGRPRFHGARRRGQRLRDPRGERAPRPRESRTAADRRALRRPAVSADAGGSMSADTPTPVGPPAPAPPPARGSPSGRAYLLDVLGRLLAIRSPSGMTDQIVLAVSDELDGLGIPYGLTRRGAIRADLEGARHSPDRAIVAHLDTLGAMVKDRKSVV